MLWSVHNYKVEPTGFVHMVHYERLLLLNKCLNLILGHRNFPHTIYHLLQS